MKTRARWSKKKRKVPAGQRQEKVQKKVTRERSFPIVGIGASAGGLEAFERLLRYLPPDTGMAFLLVQHLDPTHESHLTGILARDISMPVTEVKDGMRVAPNRVYIIPPNTNMSVRDRALHLEPRKDFTTPHMPVNFLFRSLANEQKNKAIGIILSGTASDGVVGMKAIKAEGGITIAQDEGSAKYFGMPRSSIVAGVVDFILPPEEIATYIAKIGRHPYFKLPEVEKAEQATYPREGEQTRDQLFRLLKANFGVDFGGYKHSTVDRRIKRRMALCSIDNLEDYLGYVRKNRNELERLYQDMFIRVTRFFREPETFAALRREVFPRIRKQVSSDSPIRIWVPGCSTGEEVYSIAIALLEYLGDRAGSTAIQIFGSDINEEAVRQARQGKYLDDIAPYVGRARLQRFFVKTPEGYQVSKAIRDLCTFSKHDLIRDAPFSRVDLLSCRNVLIYMGPDLHRKLFPLFHYALKPTGFLQLGTAETIGEFSDLFDLVDRKHKIYAKKSAKVRLPVDFGQLHLSKPLAQGRERLSVPGANWSLQKDTADLLLLNEYAPASVLVNENMEILHFRGHTGPYLEPAPGVASLNLLKMARGGLLVSLQTAFNSARKKGGATRVEGIRVASDGREKTVNLHVVPIKAPGIKDRTFLVVFEDVTHAAPPPLAKGTADPGKGMSQRTREERVSQLKQELATTKAYLQSVTENQEASSEELRSLNEEVMSSNEELQSTTEELETSNEELQSANEELTALNEKLQTRNQELAQANNDILNLFTSMNLSVLLLDRDLRLRRFTPTAQKVLKIASTDLGRPLTDIQLPVVIPDLKRHIVETMDSLKPMQADVEGQDGRWYALQIRPYITAGNRLEGAVVALTDISELTTRTAELSVASERLRGEQSERSRMARDVHDTMAQGFTGIVLNLEAAEEASADLPEEVRKRITRARDVARQHLEEVRRSVLTLSASPAATGDLASAIRESVERARSNTTIPVEFSVRGTPQYLNATLNDNLLRIAQQALDNALQHAKASEIRIDLVFGEKEIRLQIRDNGQGFVSSHPPRHGMGIGITGMRERAQLIGGKFELKSQPGKGTHVEVRVPYPSIPGHEASR